MMRNQTRWLLTPWCAAVFALTMTSACAARNIGIDHGALVALKDAAALKSVRYQPPAFAVEDPGNSVVGSVFGVSGGALVMPGRGAGAEPLETDYALDDPAIAVRAKLVEALAYELGVRNAEPEGPTLPDDRIDALGGAVGRDGWLLDVKTLRWGIAYDPKFWRRYRVQVEARSRLIDLAHERVVWQAMCDGSEGDAPKGSLLAELTANDAASLKERLAAAANRCADVLVTHFFAGVR
jgi:hypothetical protein